MKIKHISERNGIVLHLAFSMIEVLFAMAIVALMIIGVVSGFTQIERTAEWSAYSLAAQAMAMQSLEQARSAKWDSQSVPAVDNIVSGNFTQRVSILDVPISGTNIVYATNKITISTISASPPVKMIRVDCTWPFPNRGVFTNTIFTYRAPDQ